MRGEIEAIRTLEHGLSLTGEEGLKYSFSYGLATLPGAHDPWLAARP